MVGAYRERMSSRHEGSCTYELTVVVTACASLVKAQDKQNPNMEKGGGYRASPLAEGLLATEAAGRRRFRVCLFAVCLFVSFRV